MTKPDREAVKTLAIALGNIREAARRSGLNEDRVLQWSARDPNGPWINQRITTTTTTHHKVSACQQPSVSPSVALANSLAELGKKSRYQLATGLEKATATVADMEGETVLKRSGAIKNVAGALSIVHSWDEGKTNQPLGLDILTGDVAISLRTGKA